MGSGVLELRDLRPTGSYLLLVDASSFIHRNYHALPKLTRQRDGLETGALYGFTNTMLKLFWLNWSAINRLPTHGAVILDHRGKNWRHDIYPLYKEQRKPYEPQLLEQLPLIPSIAEAFNVPAIGVAGYEADDVIATYVQMGEDAGLDVVVASSDKDLMQLVRCEDGPWTIMYDGMKDKGRDDCAGALIGPHEVFDKLGVMPDRVADFLALTGDAVDNVPGVPGVGPKTAARVLADMGSLNDVLDAAAWETGRFKTVREAAAIDANSREVRMSRQLVDLDYSVPVPLDVDSLEIRQPDAFALRGLMIEMEFNSLVERVDRPARR